jgi:hypothetical protein
MGLHRSTASTPVLMNGTWGTRICHTCGLRQDDPLSPMMFLLVMEVLNTLIRKADTWSLLQLLGVNSIPHRTNVYMDDMILFIHQSAPDLHLARCIFLLFEGASSLRCNIAKCQMVLIHCDEDQIHLVVSLFSCQVV